MEYTINCPLPGFEQVKVTYNLGVSMAQLNKFRNTLGDSHREEIVVKVSGWDKKQNGDPFGPDAPAGWRAWVCQQGTVLALRGFGTDPNSSTAS